MSLRDLVDPECGGANPLMRLGNQLINDAAHKDDGISGRSGIVPGPSFIGQSQSTQPFDEAHLVNEFVGQMAATVPPPQSFRMDALLQEMREIDAHNYPTQVMRAPPILDEINNGITWANEYRTDDGNNSQQINVEENLAGSTAEFDAMQQLWKSDFQVRQTQRSANEHALGVALTREFFEIPTSSNDQSDHIQEAARNVRGAVDGEQFTYSEFMRFMRNVNDADSKIQDSQPVGNIWSDEFSAIENNSKVVKEQPDWVKDFAEHKVEEETKTEQFNKKFWNRLQDEWKKISERAEDQPPWLSEFSEYYDPYKEYTFDEENPMLNEENAFEKGKSFLERGDIPSAILCFESAVRQDMNNAEIWELLGTSQAENEKDPNAIPALKKSLELKPNNRNVLMALAISYTNESLQNQALRMLIDWLRCNEQYQHIVPENFHSDIDDGEAAIARSLVNGPELKDVQDLYIKAVQQSPDVIDPEIQEALGVLFSLSAEYDKAADCFRAALQIRPNSAKIWNRLGASLANGNLAVEAVEAYQRALSIEPGYIRARYNVGIICINLKAYNEAAEHFLTALNHQASSMARSGLESSNPNNQMSDTIWSTLRMAISLMGRTELQPAIENRDLKTLNEVFKTTD